MTSSQHTDTTSTTIFSGLKQRFPAERQTTRTTGRHRAKRALPAVFLAVTGILAGSGAASAAAPSGDDGFHGAEDCRPGTFCAFAEKSYDGEIHRVHSETTPQEQCITLPRGLEASSFVNETGRPVSVYQDPDCATQADYQTYPSGAYVPDGPYVARAVKIWRH